MHHTSTLALTPAHLVGLDVHGGTPRPRADRPTGPARGRRVRVRAGQLLRLARPTAVGAHPPD